MSYTRTDWVSGETPLSAENMNNIEDGIAEHTTAIANLNSKIRFGSLNTYNETPQNQQFVKNGNVATFSYQGESKARSESQLIFTIASGYRPINDFFVVGTLGSSTPCLFQIGTNGQCTIYTASSYPASRAYLSGSYIVADA